MWATMLGSFIFFGIFAAQLRFEEEILKLLPRSSTNNELAFDNIELINKIFIQFAPDEGQSFTPEQLGQAADDFCSSLLEDDSRGKTQYVKGLFNKLDASLAAGALDYAGDHLAGLVDTSWYSVIATALTPEAIEAQMEINERLVMEDETGEDTQLVSMDPLGLRNVLLSALVGNSEEAAPGGFALDANGHLLCPDKTVALAFLAPNINAMDTGAGTKLYNILKREKKAFEASHPGITVYIHGTPIESVSNSGTIKDDLVLTVGLSLIIILLVMIFSFHRGAFVWQQVVPVIYGAVFALACMTWLKGVMSLIALGIGAVVLGVAISYCLHLLIHYYYVGDVERTLREESTPIFLGCLTTMGAFMGLLFTESDLLRDFGLFATFALMGNTIFALVFLPHFLRPQQIHFRRRHGFPLVERINNLPWDRNIWIIGTLVVLIGIGIAFSGKVKFDSDLRNLDYDDAFLQESMRLYDEKNNDGFTHLYYASWSNDDLDEALVYNKAMFRTLDSLKAEGIVTSFSPVARLLLPCEKDQIERIDAWEAFWNRERIGILKRNLAASARAHGLPEDMFAPFIATIQKRYIPGDLYNSGIVPPGLMSNYAEHQESGRYMVFTDVAYALEDRDVVARALTANPHILVLDPFYYTRDLVEIVHDDFSTTLWISSIFVLIVLLLSFRNIWIALLAFLPMFVSWYVMQGYMAIFGLEFNLINIVISTFIYGIGVDYSIFVMEGLLTEGRKGSMDMLKNHKVAIFFSALVLGIVTSSLIFAKHPSLHSVGLITLIGMASTILMTYSLEPWLFRQLCRIPYFRRSFRISD